MANLNAYDSWRFSEPEDFYGATDLPEEVRISIGEIAFDGGRFVVATGDMWAWVDTSTGKVASFENDNGTRAENVPVWMSDAVNAFLRTAEGAKHVQYYITRELEG
jgi:hypothetical protein